MQKSTKRLLSMLVVLALVLGFAPAGILAVETDALSTDVQQKIADARAIQDVALQLDENATTCPCHPGEIVEWVAMPSGAAQHKAAAGDGHKHFYVKGTYSGTAGNQFQLNNLTADDSVCLLLIDDAQMNLTGRFLFYTTYAYTVNIMGSGTVTTTNTNASYGLLSLTGSGAAQVNLYGGKFQSTGNNSHPRSVVYVASSNSGAAVNIYNDVVIGNDTAPTKDSAHSSNVLIGQKPSTSGTTYGGTVNMYGGTIKNGKASNSDGTTNTTWADGGNIYLYSSSKAKFNMYAGTIEGGRATLGGNIKVNSGSQVKLYGGTIKDGYATSNGGNIYLYSSNSLQFVMDGGEIKDGYAGINGGNIWVGSLATATLNGGTISGGDAVSNGGNIFANGTVVIDDVDIKNGTSANGGNITIYSGKLTTTDNTVISGGTGRGGSHATYGGNIYLINAKTGTLLKGSITDGCALNGGNVYVAGSTAEDTPSTVEIAANISGGVAKYGSNVGAITGSPNKTNALYQLNLIFSGGTIKEGTLEDLNNGGSMAANAHIFVNTPAADADGVKVTLKGDFTNEQTTYITKAAEQNTLTVDPSWTGSTGFSAGTPYYVGATISDGFATEMKGTLTNTYGSPVKIVADGNGGLKLVDFELVTTADNAGGFANAADAVAAYQTALAEDANARIRAGEDFTLNGNVVIEPIGDITVDGTGEISGVDLGNDDYVGNGGSITPAGNVTVAQETNYQDKRYIALTGDANDVNNGTAYTFHRLQVKLKSVTINPDKAGLYYKAEYKFDDKVAARAEAYGVFVALNQEATAESENYTSADVADATIENHTLTMASHGVYGILKAAREPAANVAASQSVLNGNPYITINWNGAAHEADDANYIYMGTNVAQSLQSAIELADEKWEQLAPASQEALNAFVEHWNGLSAFYAAFIADLVNVGK